MLRIGQLSSVCFASLAPLVAYAEPSIEDVAYQEALAAAAGKSPEEQVKLWTSFLEQYPNGTHQNEALAALKEASRLSPTSQEANPASTSQAMSLSASGPSLSMPGRKSPMKAALLSIATTTVGFSVGAFVASTGTLAPSFERTAFDKFLIASGVSLAGASLVFASPLGHIYASDRKHLLRAAILNGIALGDIALMTATYPRRCDPDEQLGAFALCPGEFGHLVMIASGLGVVTVVALWNMLDSAFTVQRLEGDPVLSKWRASWRAAH